MCTCALVSSAIRPAFSPPQMPLMSLGGRTGFVRSQGPMASVAAASTHRVTLLMSMTTSSATDAAAQHPKRIEIRGDVARGKMELERSMDTRAVDARDADRAGRGLLVPVINGAVEGVRRGHVHGP